MNVSGKKQWVGIVLGLLAMGTGIAGAQEAERPATVPDSGRHSGPTWRNHAGGTIGLYSEEGASSAAVGGGYERRFSRTYGVGVIGEVPFDAQREFMIVAALYLHPVSHLRVALAPGVEVAREETSFMLRTAFDYPFPVSPPWTLTPLIALDFTRGHQIVVVGLTIGRTF